MTTFNRIFWAIKRIALFDAAVSAHCPMQTFSGYIVPVIHKVTSDNVLPVCLAANNIEKLLHVIFDYNLEVILHFMIYRVALSWIVVTSISLFISL